MLHVTVERGYDEWHAAARQLLAQGTAPDEIVWTGGAGQAPLLAGQADGKTPSSSPRGRRYTVPRRFIDLARLVSHHAAPERWTLLYRTLWRLVHGERELLANELDPDVRTLNGMRRAVQQDVERMKAFVRFRAIGPQGAEHFIAWHRPDHDVAALVAPHFAERYPNMRWSIFTPLASIHWDGRAIRRGEGVAADALPKEDSDRAAEALWRTYYTAAFNPARANTRKLSRDMPERFRAALPEAPLITGLLASAPARADQLRRTSGGSATRTLVPLTADLAALRGAARTCTGCELHHHATQTVFGEGPSTASVVLVGEQPGDVEDREGHPFVGPAGALLDQVLERAAIARDQVYVTNAVKHFAWEPRGKRRIHRTPRLSEVRACRPWIEAELAAIKPQWIVCLGGTAAQTLLGPQARVGTLRGRVLNGHAWAPNIVVTLHPAAVLRAEGEDAQRAAFESMVEDFRLVKVD